MRKSRQLDKVREIGSELQTPVSLVASLGYAHLKAHKLPTDIAVVLWLPEAEAAPGSATLLERLSPALPAVQRLLMSADAPGASPPIGVIFVECTPLLQGLKQSLLEVIDAEAAAEGPLDKQLCRPIAKFLEKMLAGYKGSVSLVAFESVAQLALRLLQAAPTDHGIKKGLVKRLVLLRPRFSGPAVYALLSKPAKAPMRVDVYYESATALEKKDAMLRSAYAEGASHVLAAPPNGARRSSAGAELYASLLSLGGSDEAGSSDGPVAAAEAEGRAEGADGADDAEGKLTIDPDAEDLVGQRVHWSEMKFEMCAPLPCHHPSSIGPTRTSLRSMLQNPSSATGNVDVRDRRPATTPPPSVPHVPRCGACCKIPRQPLAMWMCETVSLPQSYY